MYVIYIWAKGHSNISGNRMADNLAKRASTTGNNLEVLPLTDIIASLRSDVQEKWIREWTLVCKDRELPVLQDIRYLTKYNPVRRSVLQ